MELTGCLQTYAWGKLGESSLAARLHGSSIDPNTPYSELWMGSHPSGNSIVKGSNKSLEDYIKENPRLLGRIEDYWENTNGLPFLLKVLSVNKALSIQVHPDKDTAERLHHDYPSIYRDPNYKPEMAVALTSFRALCGFRPSAEIKDVCVNVEELKMVVTADLLVSYKNTTDEDYLRKILLSLLTKGDDEVKSAVKSFLQRLVDADEAVKQKYRYDMIKTINEEFPGDSGIFMALFLNDVLLTPGEAIFIPAGIPHAYLSGDCIECMASSDNVVRAGLTPKFKDIETLLKILDFKSYTPEQVKIQPEKISLFTTRYNPPVPDFGVSKVVVPLEETWLSPSHDSCQIFIVTSGEGTCLGTSVDDALLSGRSSNVDPPEKQKRAEWELRFGSIMFLPPFMRYKITPRLPLEIYFAYVNFEFIPPHIPSIES